MLENRDLLWKNKANRAIQASIFCQYWPRFFKASKENEQ